MLVGPINHDALELRRCPHEHTVEAWVRYTGPWGAEHGGEHPRTVAQICGTYIFQYTTVYVSHICDTYILSSYPPCLNAHYLRSLAVCRRVRFGTENIKVKQARFPSMLYAMNEQKKDMADAITIPALCVAAYQGE